VLQEDRLGQGGDELPAGGLGLGDAEVGKVARRDFAAGVLVAAAAPVLYGFPKQFPRPADGQEALLGDLVLLG
jgi:hypothetical protein